MTRSQTDEKWKTGDQSLMRIDGIEQNRKDASEKRMGKRSESSVLRYAFLIFCLIWIEREIKREVKDH